MQSVFESALDRARAILQPLEQDGTQVFYAGAAIETDHVHVDTISAFQIGSGKQVRHEFFHIDAVGLGYDHQPRRVFMIGFVAQVHHHRQFLRRHLPGDLFQDLCRRGLVR